LNPFDFVNSITTTKENLIVDDITEKAYAPYMVNRSLSNFLDTVFFGNEMNRLHGLDKKMQYDFLRLSIKKAKRFSKWAKAEKSEDIDAIKFVYNVSNEKARSYLKTMKPEDLAKVVAIHQTTIVKKSK
jgi:hypothetical protein